MNWLRQCLLLQARCLTSAQLHFPAGLVLGAPLELGAAQPNLREIQSLARGQQLVAHQASGPVQVAQLGACQRLAQQLEAYRAWVLLALVPPQRDLASESGQRGRAFVAPVQQGRVARLGP